MEEWKAIVIEKNGKLFDFTNKYEISNLGRVRNNKTGKLLKYNKVNGGYLRIGLYKDGKREFFLVHSLVALMFIPNDNPSIKTEINHINEIKTDNRVENLEWCDRKYNVNYGTRTKRQAKANSKKVMAISTTENKVLVFQSITQAEKLGFNSSYICKCCQGKQKTHKGYTWRYF